MLLQLKNSNKDSVAKLLDFARQNHLNLSLVDDNENNAYLPGKPLSDDEMEKLIINSRQSGIINMDKSTFYHPCSFALSLQGSQGIPLKLYLLF